VEIYCLFIKLKQMSLNWLEWEVTANCLNAKFLSRLTRYQIQS